MPVLSAGVPMKLVTRVTGHHTVDVVLKHYFRPGREDFRKAIENAMPGMLVSAPARLLAGNVEYAEAPGPSELLDAALRKLAALTPKNFGDYTMRSSPDLKGLVEAYRVRGAKGSVGAKAAYRLRETLKVIGAPEASLLPATAGIFYVNEYDPMGDGTGHTIRVCMERQVPVVFRRFGGCGADSEAEWRCVKCHFKGKPTRPALLPARSGTIPGRLGWCNAGRVDR